MTERQIVALLPRTPGERMPYYRLYTLNNGHIVQAEQVHARDDLEAIRLAETKTGESELELWCRDRKVISFEAWADADAFSGHKQAAE